MTIEILNSDSPEEVEAKLQLMRNHMAKKEEERKKRIKKLFGSIQLNEDPVVMQRRWRDEW